MKWQSLVAAVVFLAGTVRCQLPCVFRPGGQDSKLWIFNSRPGELVEYPNFRSATGTVDGDAFWKVIPSELFQRTNRLCMVTNTTYVVHMDNPVAGPAVYLYRAEVRFAVRNAQGHLVPDFSRGLITGTPVAETAGVPAPGYYQYRQGSTLSVITSFDPATELGIAFVLYGQPGQTPSSGNVQRGVVSAGERYGQAPQPSFSGVRDGRTGQLSLLVPPLVQQAGEFMFATGFEEAMVTVSATSAGGGSEPWEMNSGVGAYYNDLASRGGRLRLYVEEDGLRGGPNGPTGYVMVPLLSLDLGMRRYSVPGLLCEISCDISDPTSLILVSWGWFPALARRDAFTNFADAYGSSSWIDVPQSSNLIGLRLRLEGLLIGFPASSLFFFSATNRIDLSLR